jgi:methyl-accepting chemotaxis protein
MTSDILQASGTNASPPGARRFLGARAGVLLGAVGGFFAAWLGAHDAWWWAAAAGLGAVWVAMTWLLPASGQDWADSEIQASAGLGEQPVRLVQQVVPVWKRNMDAAQSHAERSMNALLESFSSISEHLDRALGGQGDSPLLEAGAIDALLTNHRPLLDTLLSATRHAVKLKEQMAQGVNDMSGELAELVKLSKEVQTIGRATHLLAMNASVEATRAAGSAGGGIGIVAKEVQRLAALSREAGIQISRRVTSMHQRMDSLKWLARRNDTDDDEIVLQAEESARAVMAQLIASVSQVTRSSRGIRNANRDVQADLEKIFVGLQSQDRLSQMMASVSDDMVRLSAWMSGSQDEAAVSAAKWLDRLEASYTMEEMRSSHYDTVAVDKTAAVEFF